MSDPKPTSPGNEPTAKPDLLDKTFNVALILKGLDGLLELVGGILLIVISPETMAGVMADNEGDEAIASSIVSNQVGKIDA